MEATPTPVGVWIMLGTFLGFGISGLFALVVCLVNAAEERSKKAAEERNGLDYAVTTVPPDKADAYRSARPMDPEFWVFQRALLEDADYAEHHARLRKDGRRFAAAHPGMAIFVTSMKLPVW